MQKNDQYKKWEKTNFSKALPMAFDKFRFLDFTDITIEKFAGINFAIAVTQTLYFRHPALSCKLSTF